MLEVEIIHSCGKAKLIKEFVLERWLVCKSSLRGHIAVPPSKSQCIRAILFGMLGNGLTTVHNCLVSPDVAAMERACEQLGAKIQRTGERSLEIKGVNRCPKTPADVIDAGNSGLVLRFIGAIAALTGGYTVITGDRSVRSQRLISPLIDGLSALGAFAQSSQRNGYAPLIVRGPLYPGVATILGEDSQPVSALLIAASFLEGPTEITVTHPGEKPWVGLTLHWMDRLGLDCKHQDFTHYTLKGNGRYQGFSYTVPGDFSSAAFPLVAALLTDSEVTLTHLDHTDPQGDKKLIEILQNMGAHIDVDEHGLTVRRGGMLKGAVIDVNDCIDAITILAVVGCFASGETRIFNAASARNKECDRIACIAKELRKMGASIEETRDGLVIQHSRLHSAQVYAHGDHRMAMSLVVAALATPGETIVEGGECVVKSYPQFIEHMQSLGAHIS